MLTGLFKRRRDAHREGRNEPKVAEGERIYAIGDVHGRIDLLDRLLDKIADDMAQHQDGRTAKLVLLGDYVDRGEASAAVLAKVEALFADGAVCLMGNHEAALIDFIEAPVEGARWLDFGGLQTLASYGIGLANRRDLHGLSGAARALGEAMGAHLALLREHLAPYHQSGDVVFVHAALDPTRTLSEQTEDALLWGDEDFVRKGWRDGTLVVHGHYASPEVVCAQGRICVDTGAYYTNVLTALRLDDAVGILSTRDKNIL